MDRRQQLLDSLVAPDCPGAIATLVSATGEVWSGASTGLDPDATFRCASVTKTYVAAAVLRLVELGRLSLADPVDLGDGSTATVEQLLRHTSGLADHASDPAYEAAVVAEPGRVWSAQEQVAWAHRLPRVGPADGQVSYSDTGYVLLGELLARVAGPSWAAALRELVPLDDLGLRHTWVERLESEPAGVGARAPQHLRDLDVRTVDPSMDLFGGGGIVTTTRDLAGFFRALLDGRVVTPETVAFMTTPTPLSGGVVADLGAGGFPLPVGAEGWWGHSGFWNVVGGAQHGTRAALAVAVLQRPPGAPASIELAAELLAC